MARPDGPKTPPIRLLVVEDNAERIARFERWMPPDVRVTFARSAGRAMRIIELDAGRVYAGMLLDHDLDDQNASDDELGLTGRHVVDRIIRHTDPDAAMLVHSINPGGARMMVRRLELAGFWVTRMPFPVLSEAKLRTWIDEIRSYWRP
ncbi:cyclic-phosphate processing receiver domain-containing protein [Wenzhouxiangella marina]|uniref:Cyclic-phosphate processing Receiver domain-containing protein n=1 Tax=Wenzhouxiangella marina TaxID=1579979 RepID=A0A0K0XUL9_9GAMM|nr:cyclic-phosphate processing receiver domain-containing protein [Wenzhouxiangella marina]AKS41378.1 hypothetical protein WM2015_1001 [Wenzhouxiangella marina]MBB6086868.1 CheY-like chemotaxis protein [Wenzhouxiangella marina]